MPVTVDELRRRLDVPAELVDDAALAPFLEVASNNVAPWVTVVTTPPHPHQANIDEATYQLAVKLWDASTKGTTSMDAMGEFTVPSPSATPGLVRSVFGVLGPAMTTGGVSV